MGVPKNKVSKARYRTRRSTNRFHAPQLNVCPNCGAACLRHRVCPSCGHYRGKQVVSVDVK
jgi:large subunit ribosomal protein L32